MVPTNHSSPLRLAFVGQHVYFHACSLEHETGGVLPRFFDFRHDADPERLLAGLRAFDPDVVFVFRPEIVPANLFAGLRAITVGYLTEPLPRAGENGHPDLTQRLDQLRAADAANFDRIASFDPLIAETADAVLPVWRCFPIPVADRFFMEVEPARGPPRALFVGRSSEHRESFLGPAKHDYDVIHIAHGVSEERLVQFLREADVAINVHNEPYPTYENRVSTALAAGRLVISEPLSPRHGLEPGIDYLEARTPLALWRALEQVNRQPDAFRAIRLSGRRKAERFRAARVFPRLVGDLLADVATFGRGRTDIARVS